MLPASIWIALLSHYNPVLGKLAMKHCGVIRDLIKQLFRIDPLTNLSLK